MVTIIYIQNGCTCQEISRSGLKLRLFTVPYFSVKSHNSIVELERSPSCFLYASETWGEYKMPMPASKNLLLLLLLWLQVFYLFFEGVGEGGGGGGGVKGKLSTKHKFKSLTTNPYLASSVLALQTQKLQE